MKANELMMGDWVINSNGKPMRYSGIFEHYNPLCESPYTRLRLMWNDNEGLDVAESDVNPLPLTAEILEANGFDTIEEISVYHSDGIIGDGMWQNDRLCCGYDNTKGQFEFYTFSFDPEEDDIICQIKHILFVHELQHALRLCGLDEIADNFKVEYYEKI